jgi:hypothetical protein
MFADNFSFKEDSYEFEIEKIMTHIYDCHKLMMDDAEPILNNENSIRNRLIKRYLTNQKVKNKVRITDYMFLPEVAVINENDEEIGYTDIHVILGSHFGNDDAIFILECKRLDGKGDLGQHNLNGKYVNNGVMRFTTEQCPTYFSINGMIGFCIESFDIHTNTIQNINRHLSKWCPNETLSPLQKEIFIENFDYTYISNHRTTTSKQEFKLYHLMLDMTSILK